MTSPVIKCFILFGAKSNRRYRRLKEIIRTCALRINLKFKNVYHPECTKRLIIGIIRTVTEACESHRFLADMRRQIGMVKTRLFLSICILLIRPNVVINNINNKDLLTIRLIFNF